MQEKQQNNLFEIEWEILENQEFGDVAAVFMISIPFLERLYESAPNLQRLSLNKWLSYWGTD